jgi:beta-lactamase regulating signal transducer with metallopeptidase domain
MQNILYNISQVLGITIIHSLWQGLLIYFMLRVALALSAQLSASKKYLFALTSLLAIACWFIYTLVNQIHIYNWLAVVPQKLSAMPLMLELPRDVRRIDDETLRYYYNIEGYLPYISLFYVTGLLFNTTRLMLGRRKINIIKQTMTIDIQLQRQVNKFRELLDIDERVKIGISKLVDVPCMMGYFKPIILLPFTLSTYMDAEEIEAILLHELAHIKRNDYLVNLWQQIISALLFFNPSAQLINKIINEERENCCDDLVIKSTPSPIIYAKALLKLEQTRENNMRMAMSATGKKYQLLSRIERIMKTKKQTQSLRPAIAAMLILSIGIGSIALLNPQIAEGKVSVKALAPIIRSMVADTGKKNAIKTPANGIKKYPIQAKKTAGAKVQNASVNYSNYPEDKKEQELNAEVQKHSSAIDSCYNSPKFKELQDEIDKKSNAIDQFYNTPELKELEQRQQKLSEDFSKQQENPDMKKLEEDMNRLSGEINAYYNAPAYKALQTELEGYSKLAESEDYKSDAYKKHMEDIHKLSEQIRDYSNDAEIKRKTEEIRKMGQQVNEFYQSETFKKQREQLRAMGDSMRNLYHNPEIKEQQAELRKLGEQMRSYGNDPEIKKEHELLEAAVKRLREYIKSPEYQKYIDRTRKYSFQFQYNDDKKPEKPDTGK